MASPQTGAAARGRECHGACDITSTPSVPRRLLFLPEGVGFAERLIRRIRRRAPPAYGRIQNLGSGFVVGLPPQQFWRRHLRSANRHLLAVPRFRLNTYGRRALSVSDAMAWNSLPDFIRDSASSTDCFRRLLKMYSLLVHPAH